MFLIFIQLLSDAGIEVFKRIIHNSKVDMSGDSKSSRGNKRIIRGLYYSSKWVRDLQNSQKLRKFFEAIAGEELVPHPSFSNSPQVKNSLVFFDARPPIGEMMSYVGFYHEVLPIM